MNHLFENLPPPPGGLEGLRRKLEAGERRGVHFCGVKPAHLVGAAAAVLVLGVVSYRFFPVDRPSPSDYGIFQPYMEAPPSEAVSLVETEDSGLRLVRQPTGNPAVTLYWIVEEDG